jgi:hypothetical protein
MDKLEAIEYFTNNYKYDYASILEILNLQEPIEKEYIDKIIKNFFKEFSKDSLGKFN